MEDIFMLKINLRDYYPFYQYNCFVDVPDEVAEALQDLDRLEKAYQRRMYRNKAQYSLDRGDGIEHDILFVSLSPWEIYERKATYKQLHAEIASLPDKQAKRVYAYYFLQMSCAAIAKAECVSEAAVCEEIVRGLVNIEKYLKKFY
jgi:RNA polymerase sigma-70 factor (ECF subfamily)